MLGYTLCVQQSGIDCFLSKIDTCNEPFVIGFSDNTKDIILDTEENMLVLQDYIWKTKHMSTEVVIVEVEE